MPSSLTDLQRAYDRALAYVTAVAGEIERRGDVSEFWAESFAERPPTPSFNDMLVMRRGGFTYGVGELRPTADLDAERRWAESTFAVVHASAPGIDLAAFPEPSTGSPFVFRFDDLTLSGSAIINALTSHRVVEHCVARGLDRAPLRVLEIGAGYGLGAYQLCQRLDIASYTICDLPDNLFLSANFLQASLPERAAAFVGDGGSGDIQNAGLVFVAPPHLSEIQGEFDLVVNAYSLQEMNRASVDEYYAFIAEHLAPKGIFYSLNSHGKAGITRPSEYQVELFDLLGFTAIRRAPFFVFATEPYELLLGRRSPDAIPREALSEWLDAIGGLMQLGFNEELATMCQTIESGALLPSNELLDCFRELVWGSDLRRKRLAVEALRSLESPISCDYLAGMLDFAVRDWSSAARLLSAGLTEAPRTHAYTRGTLMLACAEQAAGKRRAAAEATALAVASAPHLAEEIRLLAREPDSCSALVASQIGLSMSRGPATFGRRALAKAKRTLRTHG